MSLQELKAEGLLRGPLADPDDFCIEWGMAIGSHGYGVSWNRKTSKVELVHRMIVDAPDGMEVDHLCLNRPCFRRDRYA